MQSEITRELPLWQRNEESIEETSEDIRGLQFSKHKNLYDPEGWLTDDNSY